MLEDYFELKRPKKIQASLLADEGRALWSEILATATTSFLDLVWVIVGAEL